MVGAAGVLLMALPGTPDANVALTKGIPGGLAGPQPRQRPRGNSRIWTGWRGGRSRYLAAAAVRHPDFDKFRWWGRNRFGPHGPTICGGRLRIWGNCWR